MQGVKGDSGACKPGERGKSTQPMRPSAHARKACAHALRRAHSHCIRRTARGWRAATRACAAERGDALYRLGQVSAAKAEAEEHDRQRHACSRPATVAQGHSFERLWPRIEDVNSFDVGLPLKCTPESVRGALDAADG